LTAPTSNIPELASFPSPFPLAHGCLRALEPADTSVAELHARLLDGSYEKPFIIEDDEHGFLHFGMAFIQSAMRLAAPDALDLRYTQKMMGFLLFKRNPGRIALLGLGGGSLAKFCYRALPAATITAIEIDPHVIALRRYFAIPDDDARFRVIRGDAIDYVAGASASIDVLLADAFDADGLAPTLANREFFERAHAALSPSGILVMNLAGEKSRYLDLVDTVRAVFDHQTLLLPVRDDGNHILYAFKQRLFEPDWKRLRQRAKELKAQHGLDFPAFAQKMEESARGRGTSLHRVIDQWARTKRSAEERTRQGGRRKG
jgi:spermidine synthase